MSFAIFSYCELPIRNSVKISNYYGQLSMKTSLQWECMYWATRENFACWMLLLIVCKCVMEKEFWTRQAHLLASLQRWGATETSLFSNRNNNAVFESSTCNALHCQLYVNTFYLCELIYLSTASAVTRVIAALVGPIILRCRLYHRLYTFVRIPRRSLRNRGAIWD
jgi:hypothetical protein